MRVRLTRKLADMIDGVDVRAYSPGDVVDFPPADARLLIAEEWGIEERRFRSGAAPGEERRREIGDRPLERTG